MRPLPETSVRILALDNVEAFDTVEADDIEACRRVLGYTPAEFAEQLGWSLRRYQRALEAAREDTFAERDVALAVRGLVDVLLGTEDSALVVDAEVGSPLPTKREDVTFFCLLAVLDGQSRRPLAWATEAPHFMAFLGSAERGRFFVPA